MRPGVVLSACLLVLICYASVSAQQPESDNTKLNEPQFNEIMVISTPIIEGNRVDRYAGQATSITEEQISDLNARDIGTALRKTPGVTISRYDQVGSFGGAEGGGVFIRGMGSSRPGGEFRFYIDGVPKDNPVFSHPLLDIVSIDPAQSITVYKSAQPWLFGNSFAAIDMQSKRMTEEGFKTKASASYGSYNTLIQTLEHGGKSDDFDYYLGQSFRSSEGHRDDSDGQLQDYFVRLGQKVYDNWDLTWLGNHTNNFAHDPGVEDQPATKNGKYETWDWFNVVTLSNDYGNSAGHIKLYWHHGDAEWLEQAGADDDTLFDWDSYGLRARQAWEIWEGGEIVLGYDWDFMAGDAEFTQDSGTTSNFDRDTFHIASPYVAVSQLLGDESAFHATPSAGIRYYAHNIYDSEWAPHAGLILGYKATQLHFGYARGVNYPGLNVAVFSQAIITPLANSPLRDDWKNLEAETLDHYEVGLSHSFGPQLKADVTFFYDDGQNRYVLTVPPPAPPTFENIDSFTTRGVEATVTALPLDTLTLFAGATYLETTPDDLPYAPEWTFSSGLNWQFLERFRLSLDGLYVTEMFVGGQNRKEGDLNTSEVDGYFLLNSKLGWMFEIEQFGIKESEVFIAGENLTDTDYEYRSGYPMPGISGMVGVSISL